MRSEIAIDAIISKYADAALWLATLRAGKDMIHQLSVCLEENEKLRDQSISAFREEFPRLLLVLKDTAHFDPQHYPRIFAARYVLMDEILQLFSIAQYHGLKLLY